jgi:hypothetical protein
MRMNGVKSLSAVLAWLWAIGTASVAQEASDRLRPPAPSPAETRAGQLPAEAAQIYEYVKKPLAGELRWQQIPWLVDLREGIRRAGAEGRPLLLFVSGDDPLERC